MKEAKARNKDIKLYGLPWGFPGWLNPNATADSPGGDPIGAFSNPSLTANYTLQWILGAKREHGLEIDYIGQWNERDAPQEYIDKLKEMVADSGLATVCLDRLPVSSSSVRSLISVQRQE
jgi:galactosylceramidase